MLNYERSNEHMILQWYVCFFRSINYKKYFNMIFIILLNNIHTWSYIVFIIYIILIYCYSVTTTSKIDKIYKQFSRP